MFNPISKELLAIQEEVLQRFKEMNLSPIQIALAEKRLTKEQLTQLVATRYQVAHFFLDMLRHAMEVVRKRRFDGTENNAAMFGPDRDNAMFIAIQQNYNEEAGFDAGPGYGGSHLEQRARLLHFLGVGLAELIPKNVEYSQTQLLSAPADALISEMRQVIELGSIEAVAALWFYEMNISIDGVYGDYCLLLKALEHMFPDRARENGYAESDTLYHVWVHSKLDEHHSAMLLDSLSAPWPSSASCIKSINTAAEATKKALESFWTKASEMIL